MQQQGEQPSDSSEEDIDTVATKKRRKLNWAMEDDKDLLELILKYNFAWDQILKDFQKFQHRRPNETEKSLEKRWKNLNSKQGKYNKGDYTIKPFKPSTKKSVTDIEREKEEAVYREKVLSFFFLFFSISTSVLFMSPLSIRFSSSKILDCCENSHVQTMQRLSSQVASQGIASSIL